MLKRILVPLDPAKPFDAANEYAVALAHRFQSRLVASYIIDEHLMGPAADEAANSLDQALEWVGKEAMEDFAKAHADLEVSKCLAYGSTPTALFQVVLQSGADTVVVGGYHPTAKPHVWGSIVVDVVHHAERPVFVVREAAPLPGPDRPIVVPFDGSDRAMANLPRIADLAKALDAPIELVHVARPKHTDHAEAVLRKGAWLLEEAGVKAHINVVAPSLFKTKGKTLLDHAVARKAALIALSRLGHHSMHTGRSRTVAWLVAHSRTPVWVVRK